MRALLSTALHDSADRVGASLVRRRLLSSASSASLLDSCRRCRPGGIAMATSWLPAWRFPHAGAGRSGALRGGAARLSRETRNQSQ